jgi:hypothetical protein
MPRLYRWSMLIIWMRQFGLSVVVGSLIVIPSISQDWKTTAVRPAECCPDFHLFHSIFSSLLQMLLPLRPRSEILLFPTILHVDVVYLDRADWIDSKTSTSIRASALSCSVALDPMTRWASARPARTACSRLYLWWCRRVVSG